MINEICEYINNQLIELKLQLNAYVEDNYIIIKIKQKDIHATKLLSIKILNNKISFGSGLGSELDLANPKCFDYIIMYIVSWYVCYVKYAIDNKIVIPLFPWDNRQLVAHSEVLEVKNTEELIKVLFSINKIPD